MRPARIIRLVFRIFLLVCTLSLSVVSVLVGLSAVNILTNTENIDLDMDSINIYINATQPDESYISIPFSITNDGYFDLTDLTFFLTIELDYNSSHLKQLIHDGDKTFPDIKKTETLNDNYNASSLSLPSGIFIPNFVIVNFSMTAWYSFNLINIRVEVSNKTIPIS